MSQLKSRLARVEGRSRIADQEETFAFGGDVLLQRFDLVENEDGETAEVLVGEVYRQFVMNADHKPMSGERVVGFEPVRITQAAFSSMLDAVMNTSRSI